MYKFTIIIPVYQEYNIFSMFIDSLLNSIDMKTQIIIINDNSPNNVAMAIYDLIKKENDNISIQVINHDVNLGSAQSINEALPLVDGEIVVFLDSDTILHGSWQLQLASTFNSPDIGGVGAILLYPQTNGVQCSGLVYTYGTGRHLKLNARQEDIESKKYEVQSTIFAFFATKSNIIQKIGCLDLHYFNGYEDIDYQMRIRQAGYKIVIDPCLQFYHWEKSNGVHREYNRRSNLGILWKRYGNFIEEDLWEHIFAQLNKMLPDNSFIGVDICGSRLDAETFWRQANIRTPGLVSEHINYSHLVKDKMSVWLPEILHYDFFRTQQNLMFLCDNFVQLTQNDYWLKFRQNYSRGDIIVDLNGNVMPFAKLENTFWPGNKIR